ncbi:hypothetical protein [Lacticaseibacillus paracasei]|uniref:hypothetical protein n=1 Tax=Lacticaseibacillus paracasei TaxID=1597 RepID=UPI0034656B3D
MTETKRDVFEGLLESYMYSADMVIDEISTDGVADRLNLGNIIASTRDRYAAALPDDLPVIPKSISEYIKNLHKFHRDLVDVFGMVRDLGITRTEPTGVFVWVTHNIDTFARAWLLGVWRVEETGEIVKLEEEK